MTMAQDLSPLRDAVLSRARADADRILAEARAAAAHRVEQARAKAADILDRARRDGRLDAEAGVDARSNRARDHARDAVLAARRAAYEELVARVTAAIESELATDGARAAVRRLIADELGDDAVIVDLPHGGVAGSAPGRRVVVTAGRLADQGIARCGDRIREVWTS